MCAENLHRPPGIARREVQARSEIDPGKLRREMERTGGEPHVTGRAAEYGVFSPTSPGRVPWAAVSLCRDPDARVGRKDHLPAGSAVETAEAMGVELFDKEQYPLQPANR